MPFAPNYTPTTSFVNDEANTAAGRSTVRTGAVDVELANISASISALKTNLQALQRDDNKAKDYLIEPYALAEQTRALLASKGLPRGNWVTGTSYAVGDTVQNALIAYVCFTPHVSSTPFTSPGLWMALSSNGDAVGSAIEAGASKVAALASQTAAASSAANAANNATASEISAVVSLTRSQNAAASQAAAAGSAAAAASSATTAQASAQASALRGELAASGGAGLVGFVQSGTGAVARTLESKNRDTISPLDYFINTDANASAMINRAIAAAALAGRGVDLGGLSYAITNITVKNGLRFLRNGKLTPLSRTGQAAIIFEGGTMGGAPVTGCTISEIEMDGVNRPMHCIYGEGATYCTFSNNHFYNLSPVAGVSHGIMLAEGSNYNKISGNTIRCVQYATSGVMIGFFSAGVDAWYGYFTNATGNITAPSAPCEYNVVVGNHVYGGQQGIWLSGSNYADISGNIVVSSRDRGIILIATSHCAISGNNVHDTKSSGIHMAFGCNENTVTGNNVKQLNSVGGQAGIQAYVGCNKNTITGNKVSTASYFGIALAVGSSSNTVTGNYVEGFAIAGIIVQSDWFGSGGQGVYGYPNYEAPGTGSKWSFTDTLDNVIIGNTIKDPANTGADCAIALIQVRSADTVTQYKVLGTVVNDNAVKSTTCTHNVYVFSEVAAGVLGGSLIGNTFKNPALATFGGNNTSYGPDAYSFAFDAIEGNSGINSPQTWIPVMRGSATAGAGTYTEQLGQYCRISKESVTFMANLVYSGHTGTGAITIPLPTPVKYAFLGGGNKVPSILLKSIPLTAGRWPCAFIGSGDSEIFFQEMGSSGGASSLACSPFGTIYVSGEYSYRTLV